KGFRQFLEIASALSRKMPGLAEFHAIGWGDESWGPSELGSLATVPSRGRLSRSEYVRQVEKLHFICLPYKGTHYELSPSAVLLDAIAWEKPVIASRIPIMEDLFSRFGNIGCLCTDNREFSEA